MLINTWSILLRAFPKCSLHIDALPATGTSPPMDMCLSNQMVWTGKLGPGIKRTPRRNSLDEE